MKTIYLDNFITKSNITHNFLYNYSLVCYKNCHSKVDIICNIHGVFSQRPQKHIEGNGCPICAIQQRKTTNCLKYGVDFPLQSIQIQNKTKHINMLKLGVAKPFNSVSVQTTVRQNIIEKYGVECTQQLPNIKQKSIITNITKYGNSNPLSNIDIYNKSRQTMLIKYGFKFQTQQFTKNIIHLLLDNNWMYYQYVQLNKTATQLALELGVDNTTVGRYLKKAEIQIRKYHQSYVSKLWMESIIYNSGINMEYEYPIIGTRYKADGYCKETNTIYEFYGDYWHGNPEIYSPNIKHPIINKTMGELYQNTIKREKYIKQLGYNLVVIWENTYKKGL